MFTAATSGANWFNQQQSNVRASIQSVQTKPVQSSLLQTCDIPSSPLRSFLVLPNLSGPIRFHMVGFNAIQLHAVQSISVHSSRELTSVTRSTCIRMWKAAKKRANAPFYSPFPSHTSRLETSQLEDADGRLKKPGLWNSLRFGKEGCNIELWLNLISKFKQKLTNFSFVVIFLRQLS